MKVTLNNDTILNLASECAKKIYERFKHKNIIKIYPVPRGGVPATYALLRYSDKFEITEKIMDAHVIMDDLIDSGETMMQHTAANPDAYFCALIDKRNNKELKDKWIIFSWEGSVQNGVEDNIRRLLQAFDPDPNRGGLVETPARVAKAWEHWTSGYSKNAAELLKTFEDGAENYNELVIVKNLNFHSLCEHHLAPFFGVATIAYIPRDKIVGLSKFARLLDMYALRLQVQERMTSQIADALVEHIDPLGVGVVIKARHTCMESRGVCKQGSHTITSAVRGLIDTDRDTRSEFMALANNMDQI